ncbi:hypothetical protein E4U40_007121, partial [Claviceps sp. LM458 group G5]
QHKPEKGGSEDMPVSTVLKPSLFSSSVLRTFTRLYNLSTRRWDDEFIRKVKETGLPDDAYKSELDNNDREEIITSEDRLLHRKGRLWVSPTLQKYVVVFEHDAKVLEQIRKV